jgi:hypothetical protein
MLKGWVYILTSISELKEIRFRKLYKTHLRSPEEITKLKYMTYLLKYSSADQFSKLWMKSQLSSIHLTWLGLLLVEKKTFSWFWIRNLKVKLKTKWVTDGRHIEQRAGLSRTIVERDNLSQICFKLIQWFQKRRRHSNVIVYQNMHNI